MGVLKVPSVITPTTVATTKAISPPSNHSQRLPVRCPIVAVTVSSSCSSERPRVRLTLRDPRRQPPDAFDVQVEEIVDVRGHADIEIWRAAPHAAPVSYRLAGREIARQLNLHR